MAPIVHGLEQEWAGQVDFIYLDVADTANAGAMARFGFRATPHFFLLDPDGTVRRSWQGAVERDTLVAALELSVGARPSSAPMPCPPVDQPRTATSASRRSSAA